MNLTEHFTLAEFIDSQTALRRGISNMPDAAIMANVRRVAEVLEQIRSGIKAPIHVSSGYRSAELNAAVGGAKSSAHVMGLAADITSPGMTPSDLAKSIIKLGIKFDQLIYEGTWVHVGLSSGEPRNEILTAHFGGGGVTYSRGIA